MSFGQIDVGILVTAQNQASGALRSIKGDVEGIGFAATSTANRLKAIQVVLAGIAIQKISEFTRKTIETADATEQLHTRLGLIDGDLKQAGRTLLAINNQYDALGVNGDALATVFVRLREEGFNGADAEELTRTIARASAEFGRTEQDVRNLGDTINKVMAKGYLDSKAAITQIVDLFPGIASKLAASLGYDSVNEFVRFAKSGEIGGKDFIAGWKRAFASDDIFAITQGQISAGLRKLRSVFPDFIERLQLDADLGPQIAQRLTDLAGSIERFLNNIDANSVDSFFNALDRGGATIVSLIGGIGKLNEAVTQAFSGFNADAGKVIDNVIGSLNSAGAAFGGLAGLVLFGPAGAAGLAILGGQIDQIFGHFGMSISKAITDLTGHLMGVGAGALGAVGLFFFGPAGLAVGAIIGATIEALSAKLSNAGKSGGLAAATNNYSEAVNNVRTALSNVNKDLAGNDAMWKLILEKSKQHNLTLEQTAALASTIKNESNFNPSAVGDNGQSFGLFQFNVKGELPALQQYADKVEEFWGRAGTQMDFAIGRWKELGGASTKTAAEAVAVWNKFERFQGFNDAFGTEVQERIRDAQRYVPAIKQMVTVQNEANAALRAPVSADNGRLTEDQKEKINSLTLALTSARKAASDYFGEFTKDTPQRMADQTKERFNQVTDSLKKSIDAVEHYANELDRLGQHEAANGVRQQNNLTQQKQALEEIIGSTDKYIERQRTLGDLQNQQAIAQQAMITLKLREAELQLQLEHSNSALFNMFAGMSGGGIVMQTMREKIQLQQQEVQYTQQIITLTAQLAQTHNTELRAALQGNIELTTQMRDRTREALSNLTAEAVAARQMWQSVGQTLENGLVQGLSAVITRTGDWKQASLAAYNAITQAAIKYLLQLIQIKALMPLLGGMGIGGGFTGLFGGLFANGAAFSGNVKMFANGGIIGGPTMFGIAGEAGKEAIMPLEDVGGKLGVRATGSGGDLFQIIIQAIDTQSGTEFLVKNMPTIQAGLVQRRNLNRGIRMGVGV